MGLRAAGKFAQLVVKNVGLTEVKTIPAVKANIAAESFSSTGLTTSP